MSQATAVERMPDTFRHLKVMPLREHARDKLRGNET
jgi:hypothetical protein